MLFTTAIFAATLAFARPHVARDDVTCETSDNSPTWQHAKNALDALTSKGDIYIQNQNNLGGNCELLQSGDEAGLVMCGLVGEIIANRDATFWLKGIIDTCEVDGKVGGHVMFGGGDPAHNQLSVSINPYKILF